MPPPPEGQTRRLPLVIDDTPNQKRHAPKMERRSWHHDHSAPPGQTRWIKGHCWVVLGLLWRHMSCRWLCFALKPALYVREVDCEKTNRVFKTKLELALDLIRSLRFPAWAKLLLIGDCAYGNKALGNESDNHLLSRLRSDATFRDPPPPPLEKRKRGRPRKYGASHKIAEWAQHATQQLIEVTRYGETTTLRVAETTGYLHEIKRLVRILVVWDREEKPFFLFTTDMELTLVEILEYYAARFEEEVTFRDLKQEVGFGHYRLRKEVAFTRYVQLTLVAHAILRLTSIQDGVTAMTTPVSSGLKPRNSGEERATPPFFLTDSGRPAREGHLPAIARLG